MRLSYNAPVVLSLTLVAFAAAGADAFLLPGLARSYFAVYPGFDFADPLCYARLLTHALGHKNWNHIIANFSVILLIGPILEEKYGSKPLLAMMAITALATGLLNAAFSTHGLMGASGLVFMMILLGSFANHKPGEIPLTFILAVAMFLGKEVADLFGKDDISQFAHLFGGVCGGLFGFLKGKGGKGRGKAGSAKAALSRR